MFLCPVSTRPNLIDEVKKHTDYVYKNDYYVYGIDSISQSERIFLKLLDLVDERTFLVLDESTYIKKSTCYTHQKGINVITKNAI